MVFAYNRLLLLACLLACLYYDDEEVRFFLPR